MSSPVIAWFVVLPWDKPPIRKNSQRRQHHHAEAAIRKAALEEVSWAIEQAKIPRLDAANVILHWRPADRRRQDGDGAAPSLSIALDALVSTGVLADDSGPHVPFSGVQMHPPVVGEGARMWLAVEAA